MGMNTILMLIAGIVMSTMVASQVAPSIVEGVKVKKTQVQTINNQEVIFEAIKRYTTMKQVAPTSITQLISENYIDTKVNDNGFGGTYTINVDKALGVATITTTIEDPKVQEAFLNSFMGTSKPTRVGATNDFETKFVLPNEVMHGNALLMTGIPIQNIAPDSNINKYWYDTSSGKATLKLYDGTSWVEVKLGGSSEEEDNNVKLTGNQTIGGIKTFTSNIIGNVIGNIVGNVTGNLNGHATSATSATNATNATKLRTPRTINGVSFDGSSNITITNVANATNATNVIITPTTNTHATNKKYVDDKISSLNTTITTTITNSSIPKGAIIMWSGSIATIPSGWALCNGANGTPDLRNRFVIGSSSDVSGVSNTSVTGANTKSGGSKNAVVVSHTHTGSTNTAGAHTHNFTGVISSSSSSSGWSSSYYSLSVGTATSSSAGAHTHSLTINSAGQSGTNANLPPYYALAFIMKL